MTDNDHIPVRLVMQVDRLPKLSKSENNVSSKIKWDCLSDQCIKHYHDRTTKAFGEIDIPISSVLCSDCACASKTHTGEIDKLFDAMKSSLYESSVHCQPGKSRYTPRPGWNDYVSDIYDFSREARRMWLDQGKPRQGMVHDMFVKSKRRLKCALNYITKNEDFLRKESLAKKLSQLSPNDFWREISTINNSRIMLPTSIEGATGADEIGKLWKNHFEGLFNCLQKFDNSSVPYTITSSFNDLKVTTDEVFDAMKKLENNKSSGADNIYAEHIKYASKSLVPLISICFTACFVHGFLPTSLLTVVLVPIIKNKAGNVNSIDNYRPVALSNIFSKILELIILNRIECYLMTNANQFGFKRNHGTDLCIYTLKEIVNLYSSLKGCVFTCFFRCEQGI
ncbi:unnamed protein product [Meganyctiphanes norvegica]|uniref:Reverse transcriptase domain-containing protein n=1 Tax=Meganyctiphanes norvegica TaxID=48144 RepID=A0AAV2S6R2_MEGNR